jgi:hypothetical protein
MIADYQKMIMMGTLTLSIKPIKDRSIEDQATPTVRK